MQELLDVLLNTHLIDLIVLFWYLFEFQYLLFVPCGESFPNCHYIKDSYEDKKTLESQ
jgi:hypothetical protein